MAKILLVEDDSFIADIYKRVLEARGFPVTVIGDGEAGLIEAKNGGYDLLLLDLMLPKMHGLQVLEELKKDPKTAMMPIYILTNFQQDDVIKKATELGVNGYLLKLNLLPDQLADKVAAVLTKKTAA